ncbi:MAG: metal-dependent transcriptional regulator [Clostridiales bacterium]|nr:metal-dependent transcriptional regulator [Clostridiales bacterium]
MAINQSKEDYLEAILLLSKEQQFVHQIDVARKIGVSQPAVQKAIKNLKAEDLIEAEGLHIYLTAKGATYAEAVYTKHCTLKSFLISLGVAEEIAERDACEMEHALSPQTYQAIKNFVNKK